MTDTPGPTPLVDEAQAPQVPTTLEPLPLPLADEPAGPPEARLTPRQWIRRNLFATPVGSVLTVLFGLAIAYAGYRLAWFVLVSSDWEIVRANLRRFMVGQFPHDEQWRLEASLGIIAGLVGLLSGAIVSQAERQAAQAGRQLARPGRGDWLRRYWPVLLALGVILAQTRSWGPTLLVAANLALLVGLHRVGRQLPVLARYAWLATVVGVLTVVQLVTGPWLTWQTWLGLAVVALLAGAVVALVVRWRQPARLADLARTVAAIVGFLVAMAVLQAVLEAVTDSTGIGWDDWGGLHLTLFVTIAGIALSFPFGVLVALGRRSSLPALRVITIGYIELIRGVPLVVLLFLGHYVIPLFFPNTVDPPAPLSRALIVITLFEAAYVAETLRGGLQAVPRGQREAAMALGLSPWKVTRLIVLPQALRAVIPAMVGQFISLFKDTSLLQIIGFVELLKTAEITVTQPAFFGQRLHTVTFAFAALIYWAGSYTMSRESRRLEARLGLGERR
jgi:general L-amino acid transport system permease protein